MIFLAYFMCWALVYLDKRFWKCMPYSFDCEVSPWACMFRGPLLKEPLGGGASLQEAGPWRQASLVLCLSCAS